MLNTLLIALVLYVPNMLHFPQSIGVPGLNPLNIITLITLLTWLVTKDSAVTTTPAPLGKPLRRFWYVSILASFIAAAEGSVDYSIHDIVFLKNHIFYMALYFLFYYAVNDIKSVKKIFYAVLIVTAVAALEVIREHLSISVSGYSTGARVSGPFGSDWRASNTAGSFFAQYVPLLAVALFYEKNKFIKTIISVALFTAISALFFTYSRKAYYALAASLVFISMRTNKKALVSTVIVILSFPVWAPDTAVDRLLNSPKDEYGQEVLDSSTESRFVLWNGAWLMIQDNPFGVGLERFKHHIGRYSPISNLDAHNYYVLVTAEMGPLGLIIYLLLLVAVLKQSFLLLKNADTPLEKTLGTGFLGCVIAMLIVNTFGSAFNFGMVMGNFWILAALVSKLNMLKKDEMEQISIKNEIPETPQLNSLKR